MVNCKNRNNWGNGQWAISNRQETIKKGSVCLKRGTHRLSSVAIITINHACLDQRELKSSAAIIIGFEVRHRGIVSECKREVFIAQPDHWYYGIFIPVISPGYQ